MFCFAITGNFTDVDVCMCPDDDYTGDRCTPGTYCPSGTSGPIECTPGKYCGDFELTEPSGRDTYMYEYHFRNLHFSKILFNKTMCSATCQRNEGFYYHTLLMV